MKDSFLGWWLPSQDKEHWDKKDNVLNHNDVPKAGRRLRVSVHFVAVLLFFLFFL